MPVRVIAPGAARIDQQRIDAAIAAGVKYLKATQDPRCATWPGPRFGREVPHVGLTALAGLTLLECKVPPSDPSILKAAGFVRHNAENVSDQFETYELSLAILFLDRLGNPRDEKIIEWMALRIMSGQNLAGGWTYRSGRRLSPPEISQLRVFLKSHRPPMPLAKALRPNMPGGELGKQTTMPVLLPKQVRNATSGESPLKQVGGTAADPKDKINKALDGKLPASDSANAPEPKQARRKKVAPIPASRLQHGLQGLPLITLTVKQGTLGNRLFPHGEDNSNTQFALMGLWAARRHGVPTEYSLKAAQQRFIRSQHPKDGGWGYHIGIGSSNTMTCVGLIGLAMGHGVDADIGKEKANHDAAIAAGLGKLGTYIDTPAQPNLYFLWSLERVAMLYDLKTIGGKDWYAWARERWSPTRRITARGPTAAIPARTRTATPASRCCS